MLGDFLSNELHEQCPWPECCLLRESGWDAGYISCCPEQGAEEGGGWLGLKPIRVTEARCEGRAAAAPRRSPAEPGLRTLPHAAPTP